MHCWYMNLSFRFVSIRLFYRCQSVTYVTSIHAALWISSSLHQAAEYPPCLTWSLCRSWMHSKLPPTTHNNNVVSICLHAPFWNMWKFFWNIYLNGKLLARRLVNQWTSVRMLSRTIRPVYTSIPYITSFLATLNIV